MSATLPPAEAVLCSYNGEAHLAAQIDSLFRQTTPLQRVRVFDDLSDDATIALASALRGPFPLACQVNDRRLGVVANFEQALSRAEMPIVFLCDQDDLWAPNKVECILRWMVERRDVWLVGSDASIIDRQGHSTGRLLLDEIGARGASRWTEGEWLLRLLRRNVVTGATIAVRRELLELALPVPSGYWHDEWLGLVAAALGKIGWIEEPLMQYRLHGENAAGLAGIGTTAKLRGALAGGRRHHALRARKLDALAMRLSCAPSLVCARNGTLVDEARNFWHRRASPPAARAARWQAAAVAWRSGQYQRFADGMKSFARDLLL